MYLYALREESEAISNKIGYYYTVNDYLGKLIQGMTLQDNNLFQYQVYPLSQSDPSDFPDGEVPEWGSVKNTEKSGDLQTYYLKNTKALNYFAKSLLTPLEEIPIKRMYASFVDSDNEAILTIGYPKGIV